MIGEYCYARLVPNGSISILSMSVLKLFTQHMSRSSLTPPKNPTATTHTHVRTHITVIHIAAAEQQHQHHGGYASTSHAQSQHTNF